MKKVVNNAMIFVLKGQVILKYKDLCFLSKFNIDLKLKKSQDHNCHFKVTNNFQMCYIKCYFSNQDAGIRFL